MHRRQLIRQAAAALLLGQTAAAERVYETRLIPYKRLELPAIAVYTLSETVKDNSSAPRELERVVELAIEGAVKVGENVDDAMDALALEIERAMHKDPTLGDVASDTVLASTEMSFVDDTELSVGLLRLTYTTTYYTHAPEAEDVPLDDLKTVDTKTNIGGELPDGNVAEDKLQNLEQ